MKEEKAFLAAIRAAPDDNTVLLVYADWLEERDDPRGEYARLLATVRQHLGSDLDAILPILGRYIELECKLPVDWMYRVNGKKFDRSNFHSNSPFFWRIVNATNQSLRNLRRVLEALPEFPLSVYHETFGGAAAEVNPCYREEYSPYLTTGCSGDHGADFSAWVVMQGSEFHSQVATEHARINEFLQTYDDAFRETRRLERRHLTKKGKRRAASSEDEEADRLAYRTARGDWLAREVYEARFGHEPSW
ncbi:MAG: TIGR02996 domain-containing protein [Planctomycetes bacterium]|nr:TIGR02996 domain-containing protein [Planctomycetota bacterium]